MTVPAAMTALLCACAALPPEELEVLQQLLPLAAEPCNTEGVGCRNGHVTLLGAHSGSSKA